MVKPKNEKPQTQPVFPQYKGVEEVSPKVYCITTFGNVGFVVTDEGVVVVDTAIHQFGELIRNDIRKVTDAPIHSVIYTHGHYDHAFGVWALLKDAEERGDPPPRIIAHENVVRRFNRYRELQGQQEFINRIQFSVPEGMSAVPIEYYYPNVTYHDRFSFRLGGLTFELRFGMGETDDATWVWIPEKKVIFSGDFLLWSFPNLGNPFKVQRYETEWAGALEQMASLHPDILVPGHGPVIRGEKIQKVCLNTARALRYLHEEVVKRLNQGAWIEQILEEVQLPEDLANKSYLAPIYGCPTFAVHAIHRRYAGWYDGNPSHLFPSKTADIAKEVVNLAGGPEALLNRAKTLKKAGEVQLALHLVDFVLDNPETADLKDAHELKAELLQAKAEQTTSFIAHNIFMNGARRESQVARKLK
ncbi:MAG: alkyl sulfatase dimerization domain-containing protein [Candidatus Jordarchaeum sp.]|uniref:alkyl sulfatase dimerization domain-containing protein n=1 Tax=Candidatus Jordarchaeum sp. TaxID=2823881 RepID=UPI00404A1C76